MASPRYLVRRSLFGACSIALLTASCGAKTGLLVDDRTSVGSGTDGGSGDGGDAGSGDAGDGDGGIVVRPPSSTLPASCDDPFLQTIYLVNVRNELWRYFPSEESIGMSTPPLCDRKDATSTAFAIAVDRAFTAHLLFDDGELFRFDVRDPSSCVATSWIPRTGAFHTFSMAYVAEADGTESLYVADTQTSQLARLSFPDLSLVPIAVLPAAAHAPALSGTGAGQLFAFAANGAGSFVADLDESTGLLRGRDEFPSVSAVPSTPFAFWGGRFYFFPATADGNAEVMRFVAKDGSLTDLGGLTGAFTAAGVSTCAPG